jgi:hypothetical protein
MAKLNPLDSNGQGTNLFNLKSFNQLKKDQTNIKILKNEFFVSNFNSVQSLNANLSLSKGEEQQPRLSNKKDCLNSPIASRLGEAVLGRNSTLFREREKKLRGAPFSVSCGERSLPKINAILRAIRYTRLYKGEWGRFRSILGKRKQKKGDGATPPLGELSLGGGSYKTYIKLKRPEIYLNKKNIYNRIFTYNNILNKNILLRNMKYNFLKSTLSSILKKKIRKISEVLEDKPIKNFVLFSYLKNCIFTPPPKDSSPLIRRGQHLNISPALAGGSCGGRTKLSLNKYKGRKFGSFINYNKIIGYKFNSTFYRALYPIRIFRDGSPLRAKAGEIFKQEGAAAAAAAAAQRGLVKRRDNIYIKDIYKLLFYLFKSMYCLISKPVLKYTNDKITIQLFYYLNIPKKKVFRLFCISYINSIKKKWLAQSHSLLRQTLSTKEGSLAPSDWTLMIAKAVRDIKKEPISKERAKFIYPSLGPAKPDLASPLGSLGSLTQGGRVQPLDPPSVRILRRGRVSFLAQARGGIFLPRGNPKIIIRWKLRKAISRLKNKFTTSGKNLLFQLRKFNLTAKAVFQNKFKLICAILSNKFNKPVELQLIRLHHPYHDSNILVNLLSLNFKNKRKKARVAIQKIYNKKPVKNLNDHNLKKTDLLTAEGRTGKLIPAILSGLNIKIAGRLMGEPIIPRITSKVFGYGASAIGKVNYLDVARITKKNRKGAYTIKITSGQNFF